MHEEFITAIHACRRLRLTFRAEEDGRLRTRTCAPMDFGAGRKMKDSAPRYWVWDYDSPDGPHTLPLLPGQIVSMEPTDEPFDAAEFVTWSPSWIVPRDWGRFS